MKPVTNPKTKAKAPAKRPATPKRSVGKAVAPGLKPLDNRERLFVEFYLASEKLDPMEAAIKAGYAATVASAKSYGWVGNVRSKPHVYAAVRAGMERIANEAQIDQQMIVRGLIHELSADPNKLVQYRRPPCRCCYGKGNRYQFTPNEMELAREKHAITIIQAKAAQIMLTSNEMTFDEKGGLGYDPRKEPNPDCPECFGEGKGEIFVQDTRKLDEKSRSLYAGVHQGKDGLKLLMHDKNAARTLLMRHAGMLNDKLKLQGDAENPLIALIQQISGTGLKPVADPSADD